MQQSINIVAQILMKEPEERMSLHEVMQHPWVTCRGTAPLPTVAASGLQVPLHASCAVLGNGRVWSLGIVVVDAKQKP